MLLKGVLKMIKKNKKTFKMERRTDPFYRPIRANQKLFVIGGIFEKPKSLPYMKSNSLVLKRR